MSIRALTYAARDILLEKFPLEQTRCDVMRDGRPKFFAGEQFVAIWGSQWAPGSFSSIEQGLNEALGITVTITFRIGVAPDDKLAPELIYKACTGIEQWARKVTFILTRYKWDWMCQANILAEQEACGCEPEVPIDLMHTPPVWAGNDASPRLVGPDWLSAEPDEDEGDFGMTQDVRFADGGRTTALANMGV